MTGRDRGTSVDVTPQPEVSVFGPDLEDSVVGTWFARLGVLAVLIGAAFGYRYAVDQGWIGPAARVLLGVLTGAGFLAGGHAARGRRWYPFASALSGGGIAILYLSTLAALVRYELISPPIALVGLTAVAMLGAGLSVAYDSLALSLLSTVGAFANPYFIASGSPDDATAVLTYAVAVDVGIVVLSYVGRWPILNKVALAGSVVLFATVAEHAGLFEGLGFATILWVLFTAAPFLQVLGGDEEMRAGDAIFLSTVSVLYFAAAMYLMEAETALARGVFTLGLGAATAAFAWLAATDERTKPLLRDVMGAVSLGWFTLAAPILADGEVVTLFWSVQGALLIWFATRLSDTRLVAASLVLVTVGLVGAADHIASYDATSLFTSPGAAVAGAQLVAVFAAGSLFARYPHEDLEWAPMIGVILVGLANVLALGWISREASFEIRRRVMPEHVFAAIHFGQTLIWAVYASALLVVGIAKRVVWQRYLAIALFALTIVKMVSIDVWELSVLHRMVAFIGLGVLLLICSLSYNRFRSLVVDPPSGAG